MTDDELVEAQRAEGRPHRSDCSLHNEPAYPAKPCDCGMSKVTRKGGQIEKPEGSAWLKE